MPKDHIYLDYNASTPVAAEVTAALLPWLQEAYGNPSCTHWAGQPALRAVEQARAEVADLLGCKPAEIVFTSGGSEANNHALIGMFLARRDRGRHIVSTTIEHPAVTQPLRYLEQFFGAEVTLVPVDQTGRVAAGDVAAALRDDTVLVSVMHANNEVGTVQPIAEIATAARARGIPLHCDAAQSVGKLPIAVDALGVDLLSIAGHKLYAPKGVGALYIRAGCQPVSLVHGAGHESGRRAGTESAALAVALGTACRLAGEHLPLTELAALRDGFWEAQRAWLGDAVVLNGHPTERLPNTLNVCYRDQVGGEILAAMPHVAASTGSACHEDQVTLSPVLEAMQVPPELGRGAVRWSLGRHTTQAELDAVLTSLREVIATPAR